MFFSYLGSMPRESQIQILDNWNKLRARQESEIHKLKEQQLRLEKIKAEQKKVKEEQEKKLAEQEKFMEYIRKNPPTTFSGMISVGNFMGEYYKTKNNLASLSDNYCDKSTQYNESDIEDENNDTEDENNDIEDENNDVEDENSQNDTIEQSDNKSWFSW